MTDDTKGKVIPFVIFIAPNDSAIEYVKKYHNENTYYIINDANEINKELIEQLKPKVAQKYNLVITGFKKAFDQLFNILQESERFLIPNSIFIFEGGAITSATVKLWQDKQVLFYNKILSTHINEGMYASEIKYDSFSRNNIINNLQEDRVKELQKFLNSEKNICQIIGLKGSGKSQFIHEALENLNNTKLIYIDCKRGVLSLFQQLCKKLNLSQELSDIEERFLPTQIQIISESICRFLSKTTNISIIFSNLHGCIDKDKKLPVIFEAFLMYFSDELLIGKTNNLLLESRIKIHFSEYELQKNVVDFFLFPLKTQQTLSLFRHYYQLESRTQLVPMGNSEIDYSEDEFTYLAHKLHQITGGLPGLIELFYRENQNLPIQNAVQNAFQSKNYFQSRKNYLLKSLDLNGEEHTLLKFLSQFNEDFEFDAIEELHPEPISIIDSLIHKGTLTVKYFYGSRSYSIPIAIKECIKHTMSEDTKQIYKNRIIRYIDTKKRD